MSYIDQQIQEMAARTGMWIPDIRRVTDATFTCGCILVIRHDPALKVGWRTCEISRHREIADATFQPVALAYEIQREFALVQRHEGPVVHLRFG